MHTNGSGDSETAPEVALRWYAEAGFDFVVITDHNVVTTPRARDDLLVFRGMEVTQNLATCSPTIANEPCLLHTSALFIDDPSVRWATFPMVSHPTRFEAFSNALQMAGAWNAISVLNHPNFHRAADADLIARLVSSRKLQLIEVENRAVDSMNEGEGETLSTEALWDDLLSRGLRVYATASDDAHHYDDAARVEARGGIAYVGNRGWVMVRAARDEKSIRSAIERGDFYATTGVDLVELETTEKEIAARGAEGAMLSFEVVGSGGKVIHHEKGQAIRWEVPADARGYVRLRVVDERGHKALSQPVFLVR
jgi:hypothetical protein